MGKITKEQINNAIAMTEALSEGVNPLTGEIAGEGETLNLPEVIRTMFLIREVLVRVLQNPECINGQETCGKPEKREKAEKRFPAPLTAETLTAFEYEEPKSATMLLKQIYRPLDGTDVKRLGTAALNRWLTENGFLVSVKDERLGAEAKIPTDRGLEAGIRSYYEKSMRDGKDYIAIRYNKEAQLFIVRNFNMIIAGETPEYA